jgi:glycerophosphoryl diester phosphodiesterase
MRALAPDHWLRRLPIAHRGLHDAAAGRIENSGAAFEAAAEAGYAIELDLRSSADGEAVVFHDADLARLTAAEGPVAGRTAAQLRETPLEGAASGDTIPLLRDVLTQIGGRVPLLLELKSLERRTGPLEARVAELLEDYRGPVAVQSFNPFSVGWFARHTPHLLRGQLSTDYRADAAAHLPLYARFALRHLLLTSVSRPHFIAYDVRALPALAPALARRLGLPLIGWTVDSLDAAERSWSLVDNMIFEGFAAARG